MKKFLALVLLIITAACSRNNSIQTKAYIFERKMVSNGKLMIRYVFSAGRVLLQDSSIVENKALPQDSVIVKFKEENRAESHVVN